MNYSAALLFRGAMNIGLLSVRHRVRVRPPRARPPPSRRDNRGFALLVVLWSLVLIAFMVADLTAGGRTETRIAENLVANGVVAAAADGGIDAAIFNLTDPPASRRWPIGGAAQQITIGKTKLVVRLANEATWINPNPAAPPLMEALLRALAIDPERAHALAAAIAEWVGTVAVARPQQAVLADYRAAGLDYGPPGAPLQSLDELGRVVGMTPEILAALRPHLTLFGPAIPDPNSSDPVVAQALAAVREAAAVPLANQPPPDLTTIRITATAEARGGAQVTRLAVVRFGAMLPRGYDVLFWGSEPR